MDSIFELQTNRLRIRYMCTLDPESLQQYLADNRHAHSRWEPKRSPEYYSLEDVKARSDAEKSALDKPANLRFAMLPREREEVVGVINFTNIVGHPFRACNVGFSVAGKHEGTGLMREGLQATIPHVFEVLELNRLMANFLPRNFRSARLLSGLGFQVEGFAKRYLCIDGRWEDHILTSMLRSDWFEKQANFC